MALVKGRGPVFFRFVLGLKGCENFGWREEKNGWMGIFEQRLFLAKREEAVGDGFFSMVFSRGPESVELFFPWKGGGSLVFLLGESHRGRRALFFLKRGGWPLCALVFLVLVS